MGNNHDGKTYVDGIGDKCGGSWPNNDTGVDNTSHSGTSGNEWSFNTCDGKAKDDSTQWPPLSKSNANDWNVCGIHRGVQAKGVAKNFATTGNKIKATDVNKLAEMIRTELDNDIWTNIENTSEYKNLTKAKSGDWVMKDDFAKLSKAMEKAIAVTRSTDNAVTNTTNPPNFSMGISAADVGKLVTAYNKMVGDCICHSDCGVVSTCACHNNCGCHY